MAINQSRAYSDDEIERAMATVARIIELYGEAYWPILERLETELEERRAKSARLKKHLKRFQGRRDYGTHAKDRTVVQSGIHATTG